MRVIILINELNIRGGTHKQALRFAEYLARHNHEVRIITKIFEPEKCYPDIENFKVQSFEKYFQINPNVGAFRKMYNKIVGSYIMAKAATASSDCINVHDNGFGLINFFIRIRNKAIPIIWQINDLPLAFLVGSSQGQKEFSYGLRKIFYRHIAKKITAITVNVSKNAQRVEDNLKVKAKVLYCGVDLRSVSLSAVPEFSGGTIRLLTTGVFLKYRNYETFLLVHEKLIEKGYTVESTIIGSMALDPEYANKIKTEIEEKKLECRLAGNVDENELVDIYEKSDIFLFVNIDQSWGLAIFEAMNLGLPVIVSESVGATELLKDNLNSIILDPKDVDLIVSKIIYLFDNQIIREKIIREGFDLTQNMTWDKMYCSKLEQLLIEKVESSK